MEMVIQLLPESVEYSQLPSVEESAALAVMATAFRVSLSSGSEKEEAKRSATVSPAGSVLSSVMEGREALPFATGASFSALMEVERPTAEEEKAVDPPLVETSILIALTSFKEP